MNKVVKTNDINISIIRLVSLLMIIACHIMQGLNLWTAFWFNLGVQIFFFISGFLYGKKDIGNLKEWYKKKIVKILIPSSLLVLIVIIVDYLFLNITYNKTVVVGSLLGFQGFNGTIPMLSNTWFVSYILLCYLITPILEKLFDCKGKNEKDLFLFLIKLTIFIQLLGIFKITLVNVPWIMNYIFGYYFSRFYILNNKKQNKAYLLTFFMALVTLPISLILQYNPSMIKFITVPDFYRYLFIDWNHVFVGISLFLILYLILSKFNFKNNYILAFSDKYSYFVYLTHQIFILDHFSVLFFKDSLILNIVLILILSVTSGLVLYYINQNLSKLVNKISRKELI